MLNPPSFIGSPLLSSYALDVVSTLSGKCVHVEECRCLQNCHLTLPKAVKPQEGIWVCRSGSEELAGVYAAVSDNPWVDMWLLDFKGMPPVSARSQGKVCKCLVKRKSSFNKDLIKFTALLARKYYLRKVSLRKIGAVVS